MALPNRRPNRDNLLISGYFIGMWENVKVALSSLISRKSNHITKCSYIYTCEPIIGLKAQPYRRVLAWANQKPAKRQSKLSDMHNLPPRRRPRRISSLIVTSLRTNQDLGPFCVVSSRIARWMTSVWEQPKQKKKFTETILVSRWCSEVSEHLLLLHRPSWSKVTEPWGAPPTAILLERRWKKNCAGKSQWPKEVGGFSKIPNSQ